MFLRTWSSQRAPLALRAGLVPPSDLPQRPAGLRVPLSSVQLLSCERRRFSLCDLHTLISVSRWTKVPAWGTWPGPAPASVRRALGAFRGGPVSPRARTCSLWGAHHAGCISSVLLLGPPRWRGACPSACRHACHQWTSNSNLSPIPRTNRTWSWCHPQGGLAPTACWSGCSPPCPPTGVLRPPTAVAAMVSAELCPPFFIVCVLFGFCTCSVLTRRLVELLYCSSQCLLGFPCTDLLFSRAFSSCPAPPRHVSMPNHPRAGWAETPGMGRSDHGHASASCRYRSSLDTLSTLQLAGRDTEIRNYVAMTTRVLSRWAEEAGSPSCAQWPRIRDTFISSVCRLVPQDQV